MKTLRNAAAGLVLLVGAAGAASSSGDTPAADRQDRTTDERIASLEAEVARLSAEQESSGGTILGKWDGTKLQFKSADGSFSAQLGGRIHLDAGITDESDDWSPGSEDDAVEIRRGRLFLAGDIHGNMEYKWQVDFAGGASDAPDFKDFYLGLKQTPVGKLRAGQFKEPFSLEELTSSNYISTMERSSMNALVPARNVGVQLSDANEAETLNWAVGAFWDDGSDTGSFSGTGETNVTARVSGALWNRDEGRDVLHLGGNVRAQQDSGGTLRYRSRGPTAIPSAQAVDTGAFASDGAESFGAEAAWVRGPLSLQGEYVLTMADVQGGSDADFDGWYGLVSYFLTGESRPYKGSSGSFSRVKPRKDYGEGGGAWELVGRVGALDLEDGSIAGGEMEDLTLGTNWYLSPNSRLMFNWIHMELDGSADGDMDVFSVRWALDF